MELEKPVVCNKECDQGQHTWLQDHPNFSIKDLIMLKYSTDTCKKRTNDTNIKILYFCIYTPKPTAALEDCEIRFGHNLVACFGAGLKRAGESPLGCTKVSTCGWFNLTLRHDFQEWALMEEKGKLRCKSEQPGLYAGGRDVWPVRSSLHRILSSLQLRESAETDITV